MSPTRAPGARRIMGSRALYLVRHGQYVTDEKHSRHGQLTALGRRQAKCTGQRLANLADNVELQAIYHSDMARAVETAQIIGDATWEASHASHARAARNHATRSQAPGFQAADSKELAEVRAVMTKPKEKFLIAPKGKRKRAELIVAHGNLIRYLVRLAMRDRAIDWWRLGTNNCGVTLIWINSKGPNCLAHYNDIGHLPKSMQTRM